MPARHCAHRDDLRRAGQDTVRRRATRRAASRPATTTSTSRSAPPYCHRRHRGGAGAGARRFGRPDASLPDQDPHAIRRLDRRELHVRAGGKCGWTASRAATACSRSSVTSPRTTHCGLPTRMVTASTDCPSTSSVDARERLRLPHRRAEGPVAPPALEQRQHAWGPHRSRSSIDAPTGASASCASHAARQRTPLPEPRSSCRPRSAAPSTRRRRGRDRRGRQTSSGDRRSARHRRGRGGGCRWRGPARRGRRRPVRPPRRAAGSRCRRRAP